MLRALIVDDEPWAREELKLLLGEQPDVVVVGEAASVEEARAHLQREPPDVAFLDIKLRDESAFSLFTDAELGCHVVFVTAFEAHALRAFEVDAVDYLIKPVEPELLDRALSRVRQRAAVPAPPVEGPTAANVRLTPTDRVTLNDAHEVRACLVSSIAFVRAAAVYTEVHLTSGEVLLVREPLQSWEDRLPTSFLRIHRSTLINLDHFDRLTQDGRHYAVHLRGLDVPLPVSRRLATSVKQTVEALR